MILEILIWCTYLRGKVPISWRRLALDELYQHLLHLVASLAVAGVHSTSVDGVAGALLGKAKRVSDENSQIPSKVLLVNDLFGRALRAQRNVERPLWPAAL